MKNSVKRIYAPITKDLCITTPYAYVNGKRSYLPMQENEVELIEEVRKAGFEVDFDQSLISNSKGHAEDGQLELTLSIEDIVDNPAKINVLLGVDDNSIGVFPVSTDIAPELTIGGTYGTDTLKVIAALSRSGTAFRINGMHIDADDNKHFTAKMIERQYKHDGSSAGDKNHLYPKAQASDEQTTIRTIQNMEVILDGFGYLEIPVYKGVEANLTLDTTYIK